MMSVAKRVGRLAEVRYTAPLKLEELADFMAAVRRLVEDAKRPLVFCCDWRGVDGFEEAFADTIVWIMRRDNPRIEANAMLVDRPRLYAQAEVIVKDAQSSKRRVFRKESELSAWLDPMLTPEERQRRVQFLGEGPASSRR